MQRDLSLLTIPPDGLFVRVLAVAHDHVVERAFRACAAAQTPDRNGVQARPGRTDRSAWLARLATEKVASLRTYHVLSIDTFFGSSDVSVRPGSYGVPVELRLAGLAEVAEVLGVSRRTATRGIQPEPTSHLQSPDFVQDPSGSKKTYSNGRKAHRFSEVGRPRCHASSRPGSSTPSMVRRGSTVRVRQRAYIKYLQIGTLLLSAR